MMSNQIKIKVDLRLITEIANKSLLSLYSISMKVRKFQKILMETMHSSTQEEILLRIYPYPVESQVIEV